MKKNALATVSVTGETITGSWEKTGERGKIVLTIEGEPETVSCDGKTLTMTLETEGQTLVLVRAG